jgi:hypothetical protein
MGRGSVAIPELRDWLTLSWKYAQAILEYFYRTGLTKRIEDRYVLAKRSGRVEVPVSLLDFKNDLGGIRYWWILPCWTVSILFFLRLQILMV